MTFMKKSDRIPFGVFVGGISLKRSDRGWSPRSRFIEGRYGADALGRFLSYLALLVMVLAFLLRKALGGTAGNLLCSLSLGILIWFYCRVLSKNLTKRQLENQRFLKLVQPFYDWVELRRDCYAQRKDYAFFKCTGCGRTVRVPKGKGRIRITCRHCGYSFEKKT